MLVIMLLVVILITIWNKRMCSSSCDTQKISISLCFLYSFFGFCIFVFLCFCFPELSSFMRNPQITTFFDFYCPFWKNIIFLGKQIWCSCSNAERIGIRNSGTKCNLYSQSLKNCSWNKLVPKEKLKMCLDVSAYVFKFNLCSFTSSNPKHKNILLTAFH